MEQCKLRPQTFHTTISHCVKIWSAAKTEKKAIEKSIGSGGFSDFHSSSATATNCVLCGDNCQASEIHLCACVGLDSRR